MASSVYMPPAGEYLRPKGRIWLEYAGNASFDKHFVRGAAFHQEALADLSDGTSLEVELVPEPGNPHDPWAVAFHVRKRRIGYMSSDCAGGMHEYIAGHNRRGRAVYASGELRIRPEDGGWFATVFLPWWRHLGAFVEDSGVPAECDILIDSLPQDVRLRVMQSSQDLASEDAKLLWSKRPLAPQLVWSRRGGTQIPVALRYRLIDLDRGRKYEAYRLRQEALESAREAKLRERAAKFAVQEKLDESIRQLALSGLSKAAIARELHCSGSRVSAALRRVEASAPNANEESRNGRLLRGRQALAYQRDGLSRREIAQALGCSFETVKSILKDAKFFEDPATDPHRLQRAVAVDSARDLVRLSDAAAKLGWEIKEVKDARSDATVLGRMDKWTRTSGA